MKETHRIKPVQITRIVIGCLMLWAGLAKIANLQDFLVSIYGYELPLPELTLRLAAIILPWLEILCGIALITGIWQQEFLSLLSLIGLMFILITGQAWVRGLDISCGCFGTKLEKDTFLGSVAFAFFRNLVFFGIVFYLWLRSIAQKKTNLSSHRPLPRTM